MRHLAPTLLLALGALACDPASAGPDAGPLSDGAELDAGPADAGPCTAPLAEATLASLTLGGVPFGDPGVDLGPGATHEFRLGTLGPGGSFEPVPACATFRVMPASGTTATGATIDPATGVLTLDPATPHGAVFEVEADVEDGRRVLTVRVHVYTVEGNPLVGTWQEDAQIDCATGATVPPEEPIGELWFRASGDVAVTWHPFEIYFDYWGTYALDLAGGTLVLAPSGGNYVPPDVDGDGTFALEADGSLLLEGIWLGQPSGASGPARCGHRFVR